MPIKTLWRGRYLDGKSSASRAVTIRLIKTGMRIEAGKRLLGVWPYGEIRQAQGRYAGEPVRLERGGDISEVLTIDDIDFLTSLRAKAPNQSRKFHDPGFRRARRWWTAGAALTVALVVYRWGIPALARNVAMKVPVSWEEGLGESALSQIAPPKTRIHDPRLDAILEKIMGRLEKTLPDCPYKIRVVVCDMPIVNAFALPGGTIVVFRGLLEKTRSPEELAGVLAHEFQHILKRHTTQRLIQDSSTGLLISALSGDVTGSMAFGLKSVRTLALLEYSRDEEEEADLAGMKMILAAGIDPKGMINFFETLRDNAKMPEFLKYVSTHPASSERVKKLQDLVRAQGMGDRIASGPTEKKSLLDRQVPRVPLLQPGILWPTLVKGLRAKP